MTKYTDFIKSRTQSENLYGFKPLWMPNQFFDFQAHITEWNLRKGRSATFADCGLGKSPMELTFAENIVRKTNKRALIVTPLAVGDQFVTEGEKFGIECKQSRDGKLTSSKITVTNYEQLHRFDPNDYEAMICDESSRIKDCEGATRAAVTEFMRRMPYRMLATATAAPNDFIELGTSSEAIGELGFADMITRFFKKITSTSTRADEFRSGNWRFRGHSERDFWRWVCSWARACRKPSDLGFDDGPFMLPELITRQHRVTSQKTPDGWLFPVAANGLHEERQEGRRTIEERCQQAADLVNGTGKPFVVWCNLNDESDLLRRMIPDAREVRGGSEYDESNIEAFRDFKAGKQRGLVTKAKIAGLGLNWQHCAHTVVFPTHSFQDWYQLIRRFWRFGQKSDVIVDVVTSEGQINMISNLRRKEAQAQLMFSQLVALMNEELSIKESDPFTEKLTLPSWL